MPDARLVKLRYRPPPARMPAGSAGASFRGQFSVTGLKDIDSPVAQGVVDDDVFLFHRLVSFQDGQGGTVLFGRPVFIKRQVEIIAPDLKIQAMNLSPCCGCG
jgi:hypothetical protein